MDAVRPMLVCLLAAGLVGGFHGPTVTPDFAVFPQKTPVFVECSFSAALSGCQVRVNGGRFVDAVLDLDRGRASPSVVVTHAQSKGTQLRARYHGAGLDVGSCGVALTDAAVGVYLVVCRGRAANGSVAQGFSLLHAQGREFLGSASATPRLIVALPGDTVAVGVTTQEALRECGIRSPDAGLLEISPGQMAAPGGGGASRYGVHGAGPAHGECGFSLANVTTDDEGVWHWWGWRGQQQANHYAVVLVATAPRGPPLLRVRDSANLRAGDTMEATCAARGAVPRANLTWLLDGEVVKRDAWNDTVEQGASPFLPLEAQASVQTLRLRMRAQDAGRRLECRLEHVALPAAKVRGVVLRLQPPGPAPSPPTGSTPIHAEEPVPAGGGCAALVSATLHVTCTLAAAAVDCSAAPAPVSTTAVLRCRPGYKPPGALPDGVVAYCQPDQRWTRSLFDCVPDCGRRKVVAGSQLSAGGAEAGVDEFPWHVGIFLQDKHNKDQDKRKLFKAACGGSLVTPSLVITAAHCFWVEGRRGQGGPRDASEYRVVAGKHSLSWRQSDDAEQRFEVVEVHLPDQFDGHIKSLESDIAVLRLDQPAVISLAVNTICVDWAATTEYQQLVDGSNGTVPGWGLTESNVQSATLRFVELPFVSRPVCREAVPDDFRAYLTYDKICGGFLNRTTSVCQGDSGGGFVFPARRREQTRYWLRGVVSSHPLRKGLGAVVCQAEQYNAFTLVSAHARWLRAIIDASSPDAAAPSAPSPTP